MVRDFNVKLRNFPGFAAIGTLPALFLTNRRDTPATDPFYLRQSEFLRQTKTIVPEPGAWAMMIAGFGLVGATVRVRARRRGPT